MSRHRCDFHMRFPNGGFDYELFCECGRVTPSMTEACNIMNQQETDMRIRRTAFRFTLGMAAVAAGLGVLFWATAAPARDIDRRCYFGNGMMRCTTRTIAPSVPIRLTEEELKAKEARIAQWEAFCKPKGVADKYGVVRLQYAHEGCEFGRRE